MDFSTFTDPLLPRLMAASVQSMALVALVWAMCRYIPRLSAATRCWLWWLVAAQLMVGLLWPTPIWLPLLPAEGIAETGVMLAASVDAVSMTSLASDPAVASQADVGDYATLASTSGLAGDFSWATALIVLWVLGLSLMLARTLREFFATRVRVARSRANDHSQVEQVFQQLGDDLGLRRLPALRLCEDIDSPQLIGLWRPVLLLPAHSLEKMRADELDMAFRHELTHLTRRDLWWGWCPALAQHLFFFHPLAHLAAREYALAREAACDAAVLADRRHATQDYGRLLVRLGAVARPCSRQRLSHVHHPQEEAAHAAANRFAPAHQCGGADHRRRTVRRGAVSRDRQYLLEGRRTARGS